MEEKNWDTITAVFDYGPQNDPSTGFQVSFQSRMDNGDDHATEVYYSNGGELNLDTNKITPAGGLTQHFAEAMHMQANLLPAMELSSAEKSRHIRQYRWRQPNLCPYPNWMECVRSRKQPNAPVEAGYSHSIANIMTNAAVHTGAKATFDEATQNVMTDGKIFSLFLI